MFSKSIIFFALLFAAKALGFVRENVVFANYGIQTEFATYVLYAAIPIGIANILHYIINWHLTSKIISNTNVVCRSIYERNIILAAMFAAAFGIAISTLLLISISYFIVTGGTSETAPLVILCFLYIPISLCYSINTSILTASHKPNRIIISNIFGSIITICLIANLDPTSINMAISVNVGLMSQFLFSNYWECIFENIWGFDTRAFALFFKRAHFTNSQLFVQSNYEFAGQLAPALDRFAIAKLDTSQHVAALHYASNIVGIFTSIFVTFAMHVFQASSDGMRLAERVLISPYFFAYITIGIFPALWILKSASPIIVEIFYVTSELNSNELDIISSALGIVALAGFFDVLFAFVFALRIQSGSRKIELINPIIFISLRVFAALIAAKFHDINFILFGIVISSIVRFFIISIIHRRSIL